MEIALFVLGLILGGFVTIIVVRIRSSGSLIVDTSDPDGPYMFLALSVDPSIVLNKKHVTLDVKINKRNSQN